MSEEQLRAVEGFKIGNAYGSIRFQRPVDLAGVNLDKVIMIRPLEV